MTTFSKTFTNPRSMLRSVQSQDIIVCGRNFVVYSFYNLICKINEITHAVPNKQRLLYCSVPCLFSISLLSSSAFASLRSMISTLSLGTLSSSSKDGTDTSTVFLSSCFTARRGLCTNGQ